MERKKLFWPVVKALFWSAVVVFAIVSLVMAQDDPDMVVLRGILQKDGGTYLLDGIALRSGGIDLEPYVGKEVVVKGEVVSEDPLTIEVLEIEEYHETTELGDEVHQQVIGGYGTLLKRDDGTYTLDDKVVLQSSTIDLEGWVGREVTIKAEVVASDPEVVLEVLAICERNSVASEAIEEETYDAETLRKIFGATAVEPSSWGKVKAGFR